MGWLTARWGAAWHASTSELSPVWRPRFTAALHAVPAVRCVSARTYLRLRFLDATTVSTKVSNHDSPPARGLVTAASPWAHGLTWRPANPTLKRPQPLSLRSPATVTTNYD